MLSYNFSISVVLCPMLFSLPTHQPGVLPLTQREKSGLLFSLR